MNNTTKATQHIRTILRPIIGDTTATTYFSYYGIQKGDLMFALYKNQKFYLKLSPDDIPSVLTHHGVEQLDSPYVVSSHKYYLLPDHLLAQLSHHRNWLENSLDYIQKHKQYSYYHNTQKIRSLPNMNYHLERKLSKINIHSIEQLIEKGEINAFVELIKIGEEANHITLFKLHGAIHHQLIYTLSLDTQRHLLCEADEALYAAGLRRRFNIKR